ncbi:family 16 glycosylhydrolase [Aurantimonas sp. C2-6-R+9]|uniref:family 16 glycosylhydrolase n=1 Tax=unclassified Aurantimonas TaxID=2638230 RepID=UPI002E19D0E2|nr:MULTISPECIES: family 16 glycosylhydrolase [unclassified Aurantimonas]MEC5293001.1 family 16 glycosylhydrolase [Aurantimonas sp. C2-3-R2]MEC5381109.1 family 16 glycosylhydrolase [Aurantimonas sp. C2-6-R+9]
MPGGRIDAFGAGASRIGAILVINLDRQPRRMARTVRELARFQDHEGRRLTDLVTRLPAVDARDGRAVAATADVDPRYVLDHQLHVQPDARLEACFGRDEAVTMTRQEIAVARSHVEAWKAVATGSEEHVLILEDDVWFRGGAAASIERAWCEALTRGNGGGPAMLYLSYEDAGGTCERADVRRTLFRPVRGLWFLCGYILSRGAAQALLRAMPVVGPVDMWINRQFDWLRPLAVMTPTILQRPDTGSDNFYSVLPFLARAGIVDAEALPAPARSGRVRIVAWTGRGGREPLAMALSMLGLRVLAFDATTPAVADAEVATLFNTFDVLVDPPFPPHALPDGLAELVTGLVLEPIRADRTVASDRSKHSWTILPGDGPGDDWWPPLCSLAGMKTPVQVFPSGAPSHWRLFRDGRRTYGPSTEPIRAARPMAMDDTPWAIETVDGWPPPVCDPASQREDGAVEMQCPLTAPTIEMPAILGTFPGNLATFGSDAIDHGPDGATITLSASGMGDRPFRSGALSSAHRFLHGRFEIEMRAARGDGFVTGFFLHRSAPRQEIDVEITGNEPRRMLLNVYFNPGNEGTELDYGYRGSPCAVDLGFDASADFHRYAIEWFPDQIRWFVDDVLVHKRGSWDPTPVPHLPMTLHANLWSPRSVELAGATGVRRPLTTASFRNVKVDAMTRASGGARLG